MREVAVLLSGRLTALSSSSKLRCTDSLRVVTPAVRIPADELPRLFERFYRVERSRNRRMGGAGLGLAIASEVVRLFGGTIRVAASSADGTTLEVRMPGGHATMAGVTAQPVLASNS